MTDIHAQCDQFEIISVQATSTLRWDIVKDVHHRYVRYKKGKEARKCFRFMQIKRVSRNVVNIESATYGLIVHAKILRGLLGKGTTTDALTSCELL